MQASFRPNQTHHEQNVSSDLSRDLKEEILSIELIEDVGFADVSKYKRIEGGGTPFDFLHNTKIAIVYIARMDKVIKRYGKWYVVSLNNFLREHNDLIVRILEKYGPQGVGVIDERFDQRLVGKISFRQLAVLAGLGAIGKNTCLLHPVYGPNVVIGVVLTNANLRPDKPLKKRICLNCNVCLEKCPVQAIRETTFDRYKCKNRRKILGKGCGTACIIYCPLSSLK